MKEVVEEMSPANEKQGSVRESVRNVVRDTIEEVVYRIVKACTKRTVKELKEKLTEESVHKMERSLREASEQKFEKQLNRSVKRLEKEIANDKAGRVDFNRWIEQGFEKGFKKYLLSLTKGLRVLKLTAIVGACLIVLGGGVFALLNIPQQYGGDSTSPPPSGVAEIPPGEEEEEAPPPGEEEEEEAPPPSEQEEEAPPPGEQEEEAPPAEEEEEEAPPVGKPDLIITEVWHEYGEGGAIVYYVIENQGDGEAGPSTTYLFIGGELIEDTVGPLSPGQSSVESFPPYFILFLVGFSADLEADGDNKIIESNEQNNYFEYRRY